MNHLNGGIADKRGFYAEDLENNGFKLSVVEQINQQIVNHQNKSLMKAIGEVLKQEDKKWYAQTGGDKYFVLCEGAKILVDTDNNAVSTKTTLTFGVNVFLESSQAHRFAEKFEEEQADDECKTEITRLNANDYRKLVRSVTEEVLIC